MLHKIHQKVRERGARRAAPAGWVAVSWLLPGGGLPRLALGPALTRPTGEVSAPVLMRMQTKPYSRCWTEVAGCVLPLMKMMEQLNGGETMQMHRIHKMGSPGLSVALGGWKPKRTITQLQKIRKLWPVVFYLDSYPPTSHAPQPHTPCTILKQILKIICKHLLIHNISVYNSKR